MKRELAIFFGIVVLMALATYLYVEYNKKPANGTSEEEITFGEFSSRINDEDTVAVVMRLQGDESKDRRIIECSVGIARSLGSIGKTVKNYGFENGYCIKPDLSNTTLSKCLGEINDMYHFNVMYGKPSTKFYNDKTDIYVDETFEDECAITASSES